MNKTTAWSIRWRTNSGSMEQTTMVAASDLDDAARAIVDDIDKAIVVLELVNLGEILVPDGIPFLPGPAVED